MGCVSFSFYRQGCGSGSSSRSHPNLRVPYSPSVRDLSCFERGVVTQASRTSWPFLSPQSVSPCATPPKHNDLFPSTYASGGPERDTGRCECSPPFLSDPVSPTKSLKGLGASSHQSPPPTLSSGVPTTSTGSLGSTASRHASVPHVLTPRVLDKAKTYSALRLHTRPRSLS